MIEINKNIDKMSEPIFTSNILIPVIDKGKVIYEINTNENIGQIIYRKDGHRYESSIINKEDFESHLKAFKAKHNI